MSRSNGRLGAGDRISALPDELIHNVMSCLTAQEAVQTCVLARWWQNVWASARCLNLDSARFTGLQRFKKFVDSLIVHRGCTPLDAFWVRTAFDNSGLDNFTDYAEIHPWVCHALRSHAQVLGIVHDGDMLTIRGTFASSHLKRLHLCYFYIDNRTVEMLFCGCPVLEELELINCFVTATTFSSTTLKRSTVTFPDRELYNEDFQDLSIDMPKLVSLYIKDFRDRAPHLVDVSSLQSASIYLNCFAFEGSDSDTNVLRALSNATSLESLSLTLHDEAIHVLARDLTRCKPFRNLKALSLGEWCLNAGGNTLLYWIRCSPNIEKLILHLSRPGSYYYAHPEEYTAAEVDPACNGTETTPRCINLKKIEIHCPRGDKRVHFIVKILLANITSLPEINIKQYNI
ncbi:putative F-box/LRR-repeat protein At5g41840 isoform X1 [Brachypodium distachyon]|uniref:F-box domain-containing protein n=1 Tax=Brachypodium distachyon TaxID=15368 RepID=A0A0Q3JA55_BRADI|nr:putative F-box/LRR-repeat protein At5g41840 isoform X1 [Brachypodium distachyon]XP_010234318.1 putative F-box/LRR-repeat protein At5g41840 isoform X1 [Brachypodium distachyon]XP_014755868.1 putative F-box/LRR-repeat protein At5g41840 isoform X1 [Brachypodium distachyon]XP_024317457.1 putative F-box/LRR-repeat protein At5g41840 isoform X1 [Brachypodium distachyon]KQJ95088.1 hypothetical protein BRADI_3g15140v3 [Brachypodium distachyon]PNT66649.1 hypothetical protein BRADI_3g15140v3 [Brachypo|eukprot:XP_010234317.1 putative F-box/LRR-repeat protein At5g41840 isoform X1 [Brachypodium distachyon]